MPILPLPRRRARLRFGLLAVALVLACRDDEIAPPLPRAQGTWVDSLPVVPPSTIDLPVRYDLGPAMAWLESRVPRRLGDLRTRHQVPGNGRVSYTYAVSRAPFRVGFRGRTASLAAMVSYQGRGWYNPPVLPAVSGSCGTSGTPVRARLVIETTVRLTDNWQLRPRTRARAEPFSEEDRDRCDVTVARIDITGRVLEAARSALQQELSEFDARLTAYDLKLQAQEVWDLLQSPLALTDSLWLAINPVGVRIGTLRTEGDTLVTNVGLTAQPRVVGGARPQPTARPMPPPDDSVGSASGLNLLTEARVSYAVAGTVLSRELAGDRIDVADRTLVIEGIELRGVGDGRVAVGLRMSGPARGTLYAVGTPVLDPITLDLTMPDLRYDVATRNLLVGTLAWLAEEKIETFLRTRVRINLAGVLDDGRRLLQKELNRKLASGVRLSTQVDRLEILDLQGAPTALIVRAMALGQGELVLNLRPATR